MNPLYSALLHSHELFISIYVLLFTWKMILLLSNKTEALARLRKKSKVIGEMVLPTLFLLTGLYLAYASNVWTETWFLIKFSLIVLSVITGLLVFKTNNKFLAVITFLIFVYVIMLSYIKDPALKKAEKMIKTDEPVVINSTAPGYDALKHGQSLYFKNNCQSCHGDNGSLGNHGAKDLVKSTLDDATIENVIREGRGNVMKGFGKSLSPDEMKALTAYVKAMRK